LTRGFDILKTNSKPVAKTTPVPQIGQNVPVVVSNPVVNTYDAQSQPAYSGGNSGVQFGAFSSRASAETQVVNVRSVLGITPTIETAPNGMYRVRISGMSENSAQNLKSRASASGIDSFVFH